MEDGGDQHGAPKIKSVGGKSIRSVSIEARTAYFKHIRAISVRQQQEGGSMIAQVRALGEAIESDPAIRMCLHSSLDILAQLNDLSAPLTGSSITDMLWDINSVATTPPLFQNWLFTGIPFSVLFLGFFDNPYGQRFLNFPQVSHHFSKIFDAYALMLQSPASQVVLSQEDGWLSPEARQFVEYSDFVHDPAHPFYGFDCWNSWFIRRFAPGARPIDPHPLRITNSSDHYTLDAPKQPVHNAQKSSSFWLKDDNYSLYDMFGIGRKGEDIKRIVDESFVGGTVYQGFLSPWCYHRWHAPVAGIIEKSYKLSGSYVHELASNYLDNAVNQQAMLASLSTRHIFIINTQHPALGRVAVIEVGMGQVMSCRSIVEEGALVQKGQEMGRFEFGGSSHVLVFDRRAILQFNPQIYQMENGLPKLQKVGAWLAEASSQS